MLERDFDAILLGAFGDPRVASNIHAKEILLGMRFKMDLYANVRPVRLLDASLCPLKGVEPKDIDFVVVRENTEGVYVDAGGVFKQGTPDEIAMQEDINTRKGVERVIRYAFEYCERHKKQDGTPRSSVLMCDKSNAMTHAGGLWQRVFKEVSREYPQITPQHMYVDALCTADGARPAPVRRDRDQQHVRRHHHRPRRRTAGRAGHGRQRQHSSRKDVDVRAGPRLRAADRGQEHRQPVRRDPDRRDDAGASGIHRGSRRIEAAVLEGVRQKKTTQDIGGNLGTIEVGEWVAQRVLSKSKAKSSDRDQGSSPRSNKCRCLISKLMAMSSLAESAHSLANGPMQSKDLSLNGSKLVEGTKKPPRNSLSKNAPRKAESHPLLYNHPFVAPLQRA